MKKSNGQEYAATMADSPFVPRELIGTNLDAVGVALFVFNPNFIVTFDGKIRVRNARGGQS
jgi:hypothetical protein